MNKKRTSPYLSKLGTLVQAMNYKRLRCIVRLRLHISTDSIIAIREPITLVSAGDSGYVSTVSCKITKVITSAD